MPEGYTMHVNAKGRMPLVCIHDNVVKRPLTGLEAEQNMNDKGVPYEPRGVAGVDLTECTAIKSNAILMSDRKTGKLLGHAFFTRKSKREKGAIIGITCEAFPEFCCEVEVTDKELEALQPPKKKQKCRLSKGKLDSFDRVSLMEQFFEWESCDRKEEGYRQEIISTVFRMCTLITDIGVFKKGEKFDHILFNFDASWMKMYREEDDDECTACFSLPLRASYVI